MGLCDDYMADPFCRFGDEKRALIKEGLERIDWKSLM
jgi:hypothetical protein